MACQKATGWWQLRAVFVQDRSYERGATVAARMEAQAPPVSETADRSRSPARRPW
jgi:hypothetical protein